MGSRVYAQLCRERADKIYGMLCLETLGCCSNELGSQWLSFGGLVLPRRGNFLALVGDKRSTSLLHEVSCDIRDFGLNFRSLTLPRYVPGARSSDHWSFWKEGYRAIMVTDTAPLRYRHYHKPSDTPDKLDFSWLTLVVASLGRALDRIAAGDPVR